MKGVQLLSWIRMTLSWLLLRLQIASENLRNSTGIVRMILLQPASRIATGRYDGSHANYEALARMNLGSGGGGGGGGSSSEQFVIYAERLINLIFLGVNLHHEPLFFHRGRTDRSREARKGKERPGDLVGDEEGKATVPKLFGPHQTPATWCWCQRQEGLCCSWLDLRRFVLPDNVVLLLLSETSFHDWWNELRERGGVRGGRQEAGREVEGGQVTGVTLKAFISWLNLFLKHLAHKL